MTTPRIIADFHNADPAGRVRLTTVGSIRSLAKSGVKLTDGLRVVIHDDDELEADGIVRYSDEEGIWVAAIDWDAIRQISPPSVVR